MKPNYDMTTDELIKILTETTSKLSQCRAYIRELDELLIKTKAELKHYEELLSK